MTGTTITRAAVIIPASNEAGYIGPCLDAMLSRGVGSSCLIVVSANACTDATVSIAQSYEIAFHERGDTLVIIDSQIGGKTAALTRAESHFDVIGLGALPRVYLDADVVCSPHLIDKIVDALSVDIPRYATGALVIKRADSRITRAYARFWEKLPFVKGGVVGAGFFAVNAAGRARWGRFADIISDDTYVRLQFAPDERIEVDASYTWPMVEGFRALVKVRRRQDAGVKEIAHRYPQILVNEQKAPLGLGRFAMMAATMPFAAMVYVSVHVLTRIGRNKETWTRGR
ncbi:glycosyltransferase family 2 protein [Celeribacter marinus]|uniref:glycosyltransferase family 2 protein n=1 Tax=Celeribacter marinus TaxID=1397108 RepID=UPI003F6C07CE